MIKLLQRLVSSFLVFAILLPTAHAQNTMESVSADTKQREDGADSQRQQEESMLPRNVASLVRNVPQETTIGIVVLDRRGKVVFQHNAELELPAASSVKSILLLELFAKYSDELDVRQRQDIYQIVSDGNHPAIVHFSKASKKIIAEKLADVSINQLGSILIDYEDQAGNKYSNAVYNAAANVAIALLGGPEGSTALIQNRNEAFEKVNFRRYMLAKRNITGDNTASPLALATLFNISVGKTPKGMKAHTARAVAKILHSVDYKNGAELYSKGGTLYSDPVTQVRSGQYHKGRVRMNYAIMARQSLISKSSGKRQYKVLKDLTADIYAGLKEPK